MQPALAALTLLLAHTPAMEAAPHEHPPETNASTMVSSVGASQIVVMGEQSVAVRLPTPVFEARMQGPPRPPLSPAEAKQILARPRGTLSHGKTNEGILLKGRRIRMRGKGYAFFDHIKGRETHFGTFEMKRFIERTGHRYRKLHRHASVGIGNVSVREGGRTRWHASHQSGRDVDIAMFGRDAAGKRVNPRNFTKYDRSLKSPTGLTFDVKRNTDLVRTLITDPEYQVQWIFVARWLRSRILTNARKRGVRKDIITRMAKVMKQPGDSAPHDDHFHVRLYCSVEDRMHGCLERGPIWPWVDLGNAVFEAHVDHLEQVMEMPQSKFRLAAMKQIRDVGAHSAIPALIARLHDPHHGVRRAALKTISAFDSPDSVDGLLDMVARTENANWAGALFRTAMRSAGERRAGIARAFLVDPAVLLHPSIAGGNLSGFYGAVMDALKVEADPTVVPDLIALLDASSRDTRIQAEGALKHIICHEPEHSAASGDDEERAKAIRSWENLWNMHRERTWADWIHDGIMTAGYDLPNNLHDDECIETLIEATGDRRGHIYRNAVRLLGVVTGHVVDPNSKSSKSHRRYWRRWWERQQTPVDGAN